MGHFFVSSFSPALAHVMIPRFTTFCGSFGWLHLLALRRGFAAGIRQSLRVYFRCDSPLASGRIAVCPRTCRWVVVTRLSSRLGFAHIHTNHGKAGRKVRQEGEKTGGYIILRPTASRRFDITIMVPEASIEQRYTHAHPLEGSSGVCWSFGLNRKMIGGGNLFLGICFFFFSLSSRQAHARCHTS